MERNRDSKFRKVKCVSVKKYKIIRAVAVLLCLLTIVTMIVPTITTYAAEDQDDSYNMEAVANTLGTIMSIGTTPVSDSSGDDNNDDDDKKDDDKKTLSSIKGVSVLPAEDTNYAGNGGLTLAYTSHPTSLGQWIASKISASSQAYDYQSLIKLKTIHAGSTGTTTVIYRYAVYGNALRQLGLDNTVTSAANSFPMKRMIVGVPTMLVYICANSVTKLFGVVVNLLQLLNPFNWLANITRDVSKDLGAQYGTTYNGGHGAIQTVFVYIASVYSSLCNLSWYLIIPMSIALYLANMFLFRKSAGGKRLLKRIIFIAIGVPLIGGTYTSFLKETGNMFNDSTNGFADDVIASIFVDFENWASNTHLAPPSSDTYEIAVAVPVSGEDRTASQYPIGGAVSDKSYYYIRDLVRAINEKASGFPFANEDPTVKFDDMDASSFDDSTKASDSGSLATAKDVGIGSAAYTPSDMEAYVSDDNAKSQYVMNLLIRYMLGDVYTSDQFASSIQSHMTEMSSNDDNVANVIVNMMKGTSRYTNFPTYADNEKLWGKIASVFSSESNKVDWNTVTQEQSSNKEEDSDERLAKKDNAFFTHNNVDYSIFHDGSLCVANDDKYKKGSCTIYKYKMAHNGINSQYYKNAKSQTWSSGKVGLSTMSMYNYLNSQFTSTGVITFGGGNAITNGLTRANHYSVNLAGDGIILTFVLWLDAIVLLLCMTAIGFLYSVGMLMGTFKYTFKVIGAIPMAMMGSMRYIAKFIAMVIAMITNILVTAIMYGIVIEVILGIRKILHANPIIFSIASGIGIVGLIIIVCFFSIIVLIWLTGMLLRIRRSAVNSVTEWITQVVGKFFEADGHADPEKQKGNLGSKVAAGLAGGAALTAGHGMAKGLSAIGSALSGGALSGDGDGSGGGDSPDGGDGSGGGNDSSGGGIEKEVSQDHNNSHDGSNKETNGGQSRSERESSSSSQDKEDTNRDAQSESSSDHDAQSESSSDHEAESSESTNRDAQSDSSSDHEAESSESTNRDAENSDSSNILISNATHDSDSSQNSSSTNRDAKSDSNSNHESSSDAKSHAESQSQKDNNREARSADHLNKDKASSEKLKNDNNNNHEKANRDSSSRETANRDSSSHEMSNKDSSNRETANNTNSNREAQSADHSNKDSNSNRETASSTDSKHDASSMLASSKAESTKQNSSSSQILDKAAKADQSGVADLAKQNVDGVKGAAKDIKSGDIKEAGRKAASVGAADAVAIGTGNTKAAAATGHVVDDVAHNKADASTGIRAVTAVSGMNGTPDSPEGNKPSAPQSGAKSLSGANETGSAPHKRLDSVSSIPMSAFNMPSEAQFAKLHEDLQDYHARHPNNSFETASHSAQVDDSANKPMQNNANAANTAKPVQTNANAANKPASAGARRSDNGVTTTSSSTQIGGKGLTIQSNVTNNISKGGTINNNISQHSNGPTISANGVASAGKNVNNAQNVTNNGSQGNSGNVSVHSAGQNVKNITNVHNVNTGASANTGVSGNVVSGGVGQHVQNVTNVNNVNNNTQTGGGNIVSGGAGQHVQNMTTVNNVHNNSHTANHISSSSTNTANNVSSVSMDNHRERPKK